MAKNKPEPSNRTDLDFIQVVRYHMAKAKIKDEDADFSYVFHHVDVVEDKSVEFSELSMGPEKFPLIKVNPEILQLGVLDWSIELLKHGLWHLICGHVEKRIEQLQSLYGEERVQAAADLVVNQNADESAYKSADIELVTPSKLNLENEQTLEYYIAKLKDIPQQKWPVNIGSVTANATTADIQHFIEAADVQGKLAGHMPGEAEEYIKQLSTPPQVDWDYYLKEKEGVHRGRITRVTKHRPSRRFDLFFGRRHISTLNIAFIIDTSGSMSQDTLAQVGPEIDAISERGADIMILHADYDVAKVFPYERGVDLGEFFGRGGTSFCPAFEELQKMEWQPDFCVYFTDGYGNAPAKQVYDTLWVLVDEGMEEGEFIKQVCDWGTVCKITGNILR